MSRRARIIATAGMSLGLGGCDAGPVAWKAPAPLAGDASGTARLHLDSSGAAVQVVPPVLPIVLPPGACASSASFVRLAGDEWFATLWRARPDSSLDLVVSRSVDGGRTWATPVAADARDRGRSGCNRPAPSIAADSTSGYVHISYYLEPPEGSGVYFTHSQERGAIWHAPIGVAFGDSPARSSVAGQGDTVVVAYESPNAASRRIGLAFSRTAGHVFDQRTTVSGSTSAVSDPRVALRGGTVAVAWLERSVGSDESTGGRLMVREGTLRRRE